MKFWTILLEKIHTTKYTTSSDITAWVQGILSVTYSAQHISQLFEVDLFEKVQAEHDH